MEIAHKYSLFVIEDVTHAIGSRYKGKKFPMGGEKNIGIFSFNKKQMWLQPTGGMVVTDNEEIAKKATLYRDSHPGLVIGYPYRMYSFTALLGRIQLKHIDEYV